MCTYIYICIYIYIYMCIYIYWYVCLCVCVCVCSCMRVCVFVCKRLNVCVYVHRHHIATCVFLQRKSQRGSQWKIEWGVWRERLFVDYLYRESVVLDEQRSWEQTKHRLRYNLSVWESLPPASRDCLCDMYTAMYSWASMPPSTRRFVCCSVCHSMWCLLTIHSWVREGLKYMDICVYELMFVLYMYVEHVCVNLHTCTCKPSHHRHVCVYPCVHAIFYFCLCNAHFPMNSLTHILTHTRTILLYDWKRPAAFSWLGVEVSPKTVYMHLQVSDTC